MRSPLALLSCIGFAVLFPKATHAKTSIYVYREPPTSSPTSSPSYQPSARPSIAPTDYPSLSPSKHPSLRPSYQPTSSMQPTLTSKPSSSPTSSSQPSLTSLRTSKSVAFSPSGFGFWLIIGLVGAIGCCLLLDCFGCIWKRKLRQYPDDDESYE